MPNLIDSHCHLGHLHGRLEDILTGAAKVGVWAVIDIGMGLAESAQVADRAAAFPGRVFASVGLHPNDLSDWRADAAGAIAILRELASRPGVVGVGETGLDFYRDRESAQTQEEAFVAHIALAKETEKALVIHCRDAHDRVLQVLDGQGAPERTVMHCFSGDAAYARACAERGLYCSFAGNVTYKRNEALRDAARAVPAELLLVETDAPYLAPHPYRGKDNSPAFVPLTAAVLAEARDQAPEALAERLVENTRRVFRLP